MATQINSFYREHTMEYAVISEDQMMVTLPSEKEANVNYQVRCERTAKGVEAIDCQCKGFRRWGHCKHLVIVQEWQDAQAPKITEIEVGSWYIVNSNTQVWKGEDGQWLAAGPTANAIELIEAHLAVKTAEEIVSQPVVEQAQAVTAPAEVAKDTEKLSHILADQKVDLGLKGNLNTSRAFSIWK